MILHGLIVDSVLKTTRFTTNLKSIYEAMSDAHSFFEKISLFLRKKPSSRRIG